MFITWNHIHKPVHQEATERECGANLNKLLQLVTRNEIRFIQVNLLRLFNKHKKLTWMNLTQLRVII